MVIIDTSVAYKLFSPSESHAEQALQLIHKHIQGTEIIFCPDLLLYELANAFITKTGVSLPQIQTNLDKLKKINIHFETITFPLLEKTITFAHTYHVTVYDASYAVLAQEKKCDLITADNKFAKQVNLPFVKTLDSLA